ncbi:hypothetical protein C8R43DRAFT_1229136 [Mycena crocata]|nr:hypothetical protein C8R43DRAFT_1229136 [Mycena crocata]
MPLRYPLTASFFLVSQRSFVVIFSPSVSPTPPMAFSSVVGHQRHSFYLSCLFLRTSSAGCLGYFSSHNPPTSLRPPPASANFRERLHRGSFLPPCSRCALVFLLSLSGAFGCRCFHALALISARLSRFAFALFCCYHILQFPQVPRNLNCALPTSHPQFMQFRIAQAHTVALPPCLS